MNEDSSGDCQEQTNLLRKGIITVISKVCLIKASTKRCPLVGMKPCIRARVSKGLFARCLFCCYQSSIALVFCLSRDSCVSRCLCSWVTSKSRRTMVIICSDLLQNSEQESCPISVLSSCFLFKRCHRTMNFFSLCEDSLFGDAVTPGCLL